MGPYADPSIETLHTEIWIVNIFEHEIVPEISVGNKKQFLEFFEQFWFEMHLQAFKNLQSSDL